MDVELGGQAVMEGVLIKGPSHYSIAVRKEDGTVSIKRDKHVSVVKTKKWLNIPFVRGVFLLFEMMILGMKALTWSANEIAGEDEKLSNREIAITIIVAILMSIGMFIVLPLFLTKLITVDRGIWFNLVDGFFRLFVFIAYVLLISLMADVKRLFQYHGAEHKVVNCHEAKKELTVDNVRPCSVQHPRCGTSFIVIVIGFSILLFSLIVSPSLWVKLASRIVLIPVIAGISYELLKFSAKHTDNKLVSLFIKPGLWVQGLTTREPDDKQIDVAIQAMKSTIEQHEKVVA